MSDVALDATGCNTRSGGGGVTVVLSTVAAGVDCRNDWLDVVELLLVGAVNDADDDKEIVSVSCVLSVGVTVCGCGVLLFVVGD